MNCDRKPILQSQQSDIFAEKNIIAPRFSARYSQPCQTVMAMFAAFCFFSAASCLPLSISVIWGGAGWLVGGWDNYRNQISDERRVCLSHDPPFSLIRAAFSIFFCRLVTRLGRSGIRADLCQFEIISQRFWCLLFRYRQSPPSFDMTKKSLKPNKYWLAQTNYWQAVF